MPAEVYCTCRKKSSGDMVACDKCDEWYHYKCIKVTAKEVEATPTWFCFKCRENARQCARPECCTEARRDSKYCSDECGLEFNKQRYHRFFLPKWERLMQQHSQARTMKIEELERLDDEIANVVKLIGDLKIEREQLELDIKAVKEQAKILGAEARSQSKDQMRDESDEDDEDESITSDQTKRFCVACGVEPTADKYFKHLTNCHKKQEGSFVCYLTQPNSTKCEEFEDLNIYCTKMVDRKKNWFCPNIAITCPAHANYNPDPDEICASPSNDPQDYIIADGNYCLKLKKDCTLHYHWDRFRLASKDYAMADAFHKLCRLKEQRFFTQSSLNDTYGGVVGVMLHDTIDHRPVEQTDDREMLDMEY